MKAWQEWWKKRQLCDVIAGVTLALVGVIAFVCAVRYVLLGDVLLGATMVSANGLLVLCCVGAWRMRLPELLLAVGVLGFVLYSLTNFTTTGFGPEFLCIGIVSVLGGLGASVLSIVKKQPPRLPFSAALGVALAVVVFGLACMGGFQSAARGREYVVQELWAVPEKYDSVACPQAGTVEKITYETKAYATDARRVTKSAYVYLPYGYSEAQEYNILYLMHGTGDDEAYWLVTHSYNKTMVDNLIYYGEIEPLIIVTPTFYTEDDCADDLDQLTYSFRYELRNDLMPAVESRYSTYAQSCDEAGFAASREHRGFAGLSRGAVTMYHSALCGSLDYFAWFGAFSGSRTPVEEFQSSLQSAAFKDLSIEYLYVTGGTFDFSLPGQISDYRDWLAVEPRLIEGRNTSFVSCPMQRHAIGNWHLNLYNFLQILFCSC